MEYDYLVVGQGLAGSAVALHLLKRRRTFLVIDRPDLNVSSVVAAGMFNPITGKNWVKTWMADVIFPYARSYYHNVEKLTNKRFIYQRTIFRPFSTLREQNDWMGKSEDPNYDKFIDRVHTSGVYEDTIRNPLGGLSIRGGGFVKIPEYMEAVRGLIMESNNFREELFNQDNLKISEDRCEYKGDLFKKVIFCQGPQARNDGQWEFLPYRPVKGELLRVSVKQEFDTIFNKGIFLIPLESGNCRVGSTYENNRLDMEPTVKAKEWMMSKLESYFKLPYVVKNQDVGIRPATVDRKPFIGMHPNDQKLVIFNGLGAKGVTLAPFFANHLLEHLENDGYLIKGVDIKRFIR